MATDGHKMLSGVSPTYDTADVFNESNIYNIETQAVSKLLVFNTDPSPIVLFKEWRLETAGSVAATCILIGIWALLYEGVKFFRNTLFDDPNAKPRTSPFYWGHLLQTVLHLLQLLGGYILMLVAMTMNIWLFLSILLGLGLGYFIYGWGKIQLKPNSTNQNNERSRQGRNPALGLLAATEGKTPNHYELEPLRENQCVKLQSTSSGENGVVVMNVTSI